MGLHYLTFIGRNLENRKKSTPMQIMNKASINSKNIVNIVGIFKYIIVIDSVLVNNTKMNNVSCK